MGLWDDGVHGSPARIPDPSTAAKPANELTPAVPRRLSQLG